MISDEVLRDLRQNLDEKGYFVIPEVVSKDRLAKFNARIVEEYERAAKFSGGGSISGHLNCFPGEDARFIYDEIEEHGIGDAIRALRPGVSNDVRPTLNFNLPGSAPQHYHMDGVYVEEYIICNVAVVDTDLVNGAIDLLPSTNREFYPFWRYAFTRRYRLTTRVPMKQGDVLLRTSTLWHRGMPNSSQYPRPMMSLTFGEKSAPGGDPFETNGGKMIFYPNWYGTSRLGALRERIEVAAPITRSTVRFARSLVGNRGYSTY
ncbi:MAG TPA: phytanoyl-CoA dioxygenase family protein [Chloroflexota bacterium]|nr:phytanoyl-CoA dioxygenase family protein [Chloroflexota bacterium]